MFIEIKQKCDEKRYINIFKIIVIDTYKKSELSPDDTNGYYGEGYYGEITEITYGYGGSEMCVLSYEPVKDFMRRLKKEKKEAKEIVENRFEILDL